MGGQKEARGEQGRREKEGQLISRPSIVDQILRATPAPF